MNPTIAIAIFGALGAISRFLIGAAIQRHAIESQFPWGTFVVNVAGAFALGFVLTALPKGSIWPIAIGTGFLGSFTTFSTFSYETVVLLREGLVTTAAMYVTASLALAVVAVLIGVWLGSHV